MVGLRRPDPADLAGSCSRRFGSCYSDARSAFDLKNEGARAGASPARRLPRRGLRSGPGLAPCRGRDHARAPGCRRRQRADASSPARSRRERIVSLAGRAVGDEGVAGPTIHVALNDVVYRRDVLLRHPLSSDAGSCGFAYNGQTLRRAGHRLWFEPAMAVIHDELSTAEVRDVRRLMGTTLSGAASSTRTTATPGSSGWAMPRSRSSSLPRRCSRPSGSSPVGRPRVCAGTRSRHPSSLAFVRHLLEVPGMILRSVASRSGLRISADADLPAPAAGVGRPDLGRHPGLERARTSCARPSTARWPRPGRTSRSSSSTTARRRRGHGRGSPGRYGDRIRLPPHGRTAASRPR